MDPFAELREALDTSGANPLISKEIDPILVELVRKYAPISGLIPSVPWDSNVYFFNQRNGVAAAQAVTETGVAASTQSNYVQKMFQIRHLQTFGNIGDFARKTTRQLIDLRESEIRSAAMGLAFLQEAFHIYGNAAATGGTPTTTATGTIYSGNDGSVAGGAILSSLVLPLAMRRPDHSGMAWTRSAAPT